MKSRGIHVLWLAAFTVLGHEAAAVPVYPDPVSVTVGGVQYEITYVTTTYEQCTQLIEDQPWWRAPFGALGADLALAVDDQLGFPNNNRAGPYFAHYAGSLDSPGLDYMVGYEIEKLPDGSTRLDGLYDPGEGTVVSYAVLASSIGRCVPEGDVSTLSLVLVGLGLSAAFRARAGRGRG